MATKRMFSKDVVRTDKFLDMSLSTQALYFHLCLDADAKGFVTPRSIMRLINATNDDLNILIGKGFVIPFESGVVVVKDWRVHNYIDEKREAESQYKTEYDRLVLQPQGYYQLSDHSQSNLRELSGSIDKIRLNKIKSDKVKVNKERIGKENQEGNGNRDNIPLKETGEDRRKRLLEQAKHWQTNKDDSKEDQ